jgi:hypothetical protein
MTAVHPLDFGRRIIPAAAQGVHPAVRRAMTAGVLLHLVGVEAIPAAIFLAVFCRLAAIILGEDD